MKALALVAVTACCMSSAMATATQSVVKRDAASIVSAVNAISSQIAKISGTVQGFTGGAAGTFTALSIQGQTSDLENIINQATTTASQSAALSGSDSSTVAFSVSNLQPQIYGLLNLIVAKKPAFDTAILGIGSAGFLVYNDLQTLKNNTDAFGAALLPKLETSVAAVAPLIISDIDYHFSRAIIAYSADA